MTGRAMHLAFTAIRDRIFGRPKRKSRIAELMITWRRAEIDKYNVTPGMPYGDRVKAVKDSLNKLREVADSLIAKEGRL